MHRYYAGTGGSESRDVPLWLLYHQMHVEYEIGPWPQILDELGTEGDLRDE